MLFFSPNCSFKTFKAFKPRQPIQQIVTGVYVLKSAPFQGELFLFQYWHQKSEGHMYFFFFGCVWFCNLMGFSKPPIPVYEKSRSLHEWRYFKWSDSLKAVREQRPFWPCAVLGHSARELVSAGGFPRRRTCISKHHHLGLATSIPLNPLQFREGTWVGLRA